MAFLRRFSPLRALLDLRRYLGSRSRHEVIFLFAALMVTILVATVFIVANQPDRIYRKPDIIYVQSWPASRTDAEIVAQQKIDQKKKQAEDKKKAAEDAATRAAYKRLNDRLSPWL